MTPRPSLAAHLLPMGAACAALVAACATPAAEPRELTFTGGLSAIPNLGFTAGVDQVFHRQDEKSYALELIATVQPWDDEDLIRDGNPAAGPFVQFQLGVEHTRPGGDNRWWTAHAGAVWFRANGEPNVVQESGDYLGAYAGVGFEWQISEHVTMGPDLSLLFVSLEGSSELDVVPQIAWRFSWGY